MSEVRQLLTTVKRELKARGLTYRDVARALQVSEPSVKRLFAGGRITLARLTRLGTMLDMTLAELFQEASSQEPRIRELTIAQETELVSDPKPLLVAACVLNHWNIVDMTAVYEITELDCVQRLLRLDRLRLIDLLPGNRVRLNVARDFAWLPDGPIRRFFREQWEGDFLAGTFDAPPETLAFLHGMLTSTASVKLQTLLGRLREDFTELHAESLTAPLSQRHGTGLLFAVREWEPRSFAAMRRAHPLTPRRGDARADS